ncbi:MAG: Fic family protein [Ferruginibacter sp.]
MQNILNQIESLVKELNNLKPIKSEWQEKLKKKFRLEFNYNSNHLEGNTLTYGETELLLIFDDTKGGHSLREYEEMKAHDVAYRLLEEWAKDDERPLTEQNIKNLNQIILVRPYWKNASTPDGQDTRRQIKVGDYKEFPNSVRLPNGEIFNYTSPVDTPIEMQQLIDWYRTEETGLHPVTLAAMLHYKFVRIHPFDDGNGRISRLLVNYILLKNNLPPVIIKANDKQNYLRALHIADIGNYGPFIEYIASQLIWSLEISIKAAKGESIEEINDWEKELHSYKVRSGQSKEVNELKYSEAFIERIIKMSVVAICENWEMQLKKFDSLFYNRTCIVQVIVGGSGAADYKKNSFDELRELWEQVGTKEKNIKAIFISSEFEGLRSLPIGETYPAGTVEIRFHNNAYEISFNNILPAKSFLYDEFLSKEEIKDIPNHFARHLMKRINGNFLEEKEN